MDIHNQKCNYCYKYSAFYWCPKCESTTFCSKGGCYRLDKGHHERCPYLLPRPDRLIVVTATNFKVLFGRFMSFLLYHWHRVHGIGYAECIIVSSDTKATEFRVKFNKDVSNLGDSYTPGMLNFAATELNKEILEESGVSLLTGKRIVGKIVDMSGFEIGVYPTESARKYYHHFSNKIDVKTIKTQVYGIALSDKPVIGIYIDEGKTVYLS